MMRERTKCQGSRGVWTRRHKHSKKSKGASGLGNVREKVDAAGKEPLPRSHVAHVEQTAIKESPGKYGVYRQFMVLYV